MTTSDKIKNEITERWNYSSQRYDNYHGHGVKSDEESKAWKTLFQQTLLGDDLKILDVGCGTGEMSLVLASMGHHVTGLDLSEKMMEKGKIKAKKIAENSGILDLTFKVGDAEKPPFKDGTFDAVVTRHVLWTLPHPQTAVNSWVRVLKEGGRLIVIDSLWGAGGLGMKLRRKLTNFLILVVEKDNISKDHYPAELNAALPHSKGVSVDSVREYMKQAGLKNFREQDLDDLVKIQRAHMPFRYRISYKYNYYAIDATKLIQT
ncbi:MAG: class I SAM-dependent methyltransferase [Candidatus Bathyarchaeia archaeon]|jgi:ubiquinone/menaquinone biosynthesis C-methylase UbiE